MMIHRAEIEVPVTHVYETGLCVVGGGMAGRLS